MSSKPSFSRLEMSGTTYGKSKCAHILGAYILVLLLSQLASRLANSIFSSAEASAFYIKLVLSEIAAIGIPLFPFVLSSWRDESEKRKLGMMNPKRAIRLRTAVMAAVFGASSKMLFSGISALAQRFFGSSHLQQIPIPSGVFEYVLAVASLCLVPAVLEEYFFRGVLQKRMSSPLGNLGAFAVSAVFFGLAHFEKTGVFSALAAGICLSLLYTKTDKLLPCIICHFFFNLTAFLMSLFGDFCMSHLTAIFIAGASISIPVIAMLVYTYHEKKTDRKISPLETALLAAGMCIGITHFFF